MLKHLGRTGTLLKENIPLLIVEVVAIFLSVFLAFSLEQWREARRDRQTAEIAIEHITSEIMRNRAEVDTVRAVHAEYVEPVREMYNQVTTDSSAFFWWFAANEYQNPRVPLLQRAAWDAAVASGVTKDFEYETLRHLSTLYNLQRVGVEAHVEAWLDIIYSPGTYDPGQSKEHYLMMVMLMQSLYGNEVGFLSMADSVLTYLENRN